MEEQRVEIQLLQLHEIFLFLRLPGHVAIVPACLVTACSEGVTAKNVPLTTSSEISGPSSVLYVCPNITATRRDIRTLKTLLNHILCTIARYVRQ